MSNPHWEDIGIPEGFSPHKLLYNPPSETIIAELQSVGDEFLPNRIYTRKDGSLKYEPINDFEKLVSSESAVTPLGRPRLFYLSNRLKRTSLNLSGDREPVDGFSGDWEGLYSFDLDRRKNEKIADKNSLPIPRPYTTGWITGLVNVSADATDLYLTVGLMAERPSGYSAVSHQLARMDLATGKLHLISEMRGTFF